MMNSARRIVVACGLTLFVLSRVGLSDQNPYLTVSLARYMESEYASDIAFRPAGGLGGATNQVTVRGIPFEIVRDKDGQWKSVDVGPSRWREMEKDPLGFYPKWCKANADEGDLVLHLPKGLYWRAHVLAASDGQEGKDPVLTLRSGAFQGRGFLTDTTVDVPAFDALAAGPAADSLGGEFIRGKNDNAVKGRLFLTPVTIHVGDLLKLIELDGIKTFDVQLTRRLHVKVSAPDPANFAIMPLGAPSGVRVFGITFERSPVSLAVEGQSTLNVFPDARQPSFDLELENLTDEQRNVELTARWRRDDRGAGAQPGEQAWRLTLAAGEKRTIRHQLQCGEFGKYDYAVGLRDGELGELLTHRTTFARLPKFAKAPLEEGLKSRFCIWYWDGTHETLGGGAAAEAVDWLGVGYAFLFKPYDKKEYQRLMSRLRKMGIRDFYTDVMHCYDELGVSLPWTFSYPAFMLNEPRHKLTDKDEAWLKEQWDWGIKHCKKIRAEKPETKIIFGNSGIILVEELLYRGFPAELFDALGIKACGLMRMSERQPEGAAFHTVYWFKRALEEYGYKKPLWGWHEAQYHGTSPGNHSQQAQADLYVRDMLHGLSYDLARICPASIEDVGDGYYWSNWGAVGLFTRAPDVHPKLSYVAYAVAAHVLSDADFVRAVETGSHSAYCLEFDRRRGDKLLACYTIRGKRAVTLSGTFDGEVRLIDQQGNARILRTQGGAVSFEITPSPVFVEGIRLCRQAALGPPVYADLPKVEMRPIAGLDSLDKWRLVASPSEVLDNGNFDMPRQKGKFEVSVVGDEVKGRCLQFAIKSRGRRPPWIPSYQAMELKEPIEIPGKPAAVGLWVKGNSGWGRVNLELRDAKGERWLSIGQPMAWNANDEMSVSYIIFDGWRWMQIPLPGHYGSGYHWPRYANWRNGTAEGKGDGVIDYPLSLTGLVVEQRKQIVYVNEMVDASGEPVRLSGLTAVYGNPEAVGDWAGQAPAETDRRDLKGLGLQYRLRELKEPHPIRAHVLRVDLANSGIELAVAIAADPDGDGPAEAALTNPLKLASDRSALAFINTNPWDSLPDSSGKRNQNWFEGQPVDIWQLAVSGGRVRSPAKPDPASVWVSRRGRLSFGHGPGDSPVEAVTGWRPIVKEGAVVAKIVKESAVVASPDGTRHPRTAIGVSRNGTVMWLVVVDGRQKGYSEGMNTHELGRFMLELGCWTATNMDGGGSSIMGLAGQDGRLRVVNSPADRFLGFRRIRPLPMVLTIRKK